MSTSEFGKVASKVSALSVLIACVVVISSAAGAQEYLYNIAYFGVGNNPAGVVLQDLNHDGVLDLAVTNFSDNTVSILLGSASGQFAPQVSYATGSSPAALAAADFRRNGKIDLAVANENSDTISVLLGNGDGTFQAHVDYPVGNYPIGIVAGDFNGDGKIDLAVPNFYDSSVSILFGNGDGTFQPQITVSVGSGPTSLGSGDFNGDHKTDLVASCVGSGVVSTLLSNGNGTFTRVDSSSGIFTPDTSLLVVGDFNKDKKLDVVISSKTQQVLYILLGEGNGKFQPPSPLVSAPFNPPQALVAADFNHDGKLDVASVALDSLSGIAVSLGNGDGTFHQPVVSPTGPLGGLAVADINGDGRLDVAATSAIINSVSLFIGKGDGTFAPARTATPAQTVYGPDATVVADFNGDGKLDLAIAEVNFPNGQISVSLGTGKGTFGTPITSPLTGNAINNSDLLLPGDFNGDGKTDLLIMDDYNKGFGVLMGNGDGSFRTEVDTAFGNGIGSIAAGDFNSDGKTDVVLTTNGIPGGNPSVNIFLSNGDGTFTSGAQYNAYYYSGVATADVNHDGKLDLVIFSFGEPLLVMLGNGDGTFKKPISGPSALYSSGMTIRDFNGDGNADIVVGTYNGIAFLQGNGDGTFRNPVYSNSSIQFCCQLSAGDFNGDGKLDLVNDANGYVSAYVMLGNGDGTFRRPLAYSVAGQATSGNIVVGDFNSDTVDDIAIIIQNLYSGGITASLFFAEPTVNLFPNAVNFGTVPVGQTSPPASVQLTNVGNAALSISHIAVSGDFLQQNNCPQKLAIGQGCTVEVSFRPTMTGKRSGLLSIKDNAVPSPQRVNLKGIGQ
jgi:hypothetical protein